MEGVDESAAHRGVVGTARIYDDDSRDGFAAGRHTMHGPDGTDYANESVFLEVVEPERIVYSLRGGKAGDTSTQAEMTWTFAAQGEKTKLTLHMVFPSIAVYEHVVKTYGAIEGAKQTLDRLEEKLTELGGASGAAPEGAGLEEPRIENRGPMLIAGMKDRYSVANKRNIPALWQKFMPHIGNVPGQVGRVTYGLCLNKVAAPFSFDYMAGVEVAGNSGLPNGLSFVSVPAMRYAIFPHREHLMKLSNTMEAIGNKWLPSSGRATTAVGRDVPYMLERYGEAFDPVKMMGDIEVWIAIEG